MRSDPLPKGAVAFQFAALMDKFHLTPAQIGELTDYQIRQLFFHSRDKDGKLVPPEVPRPPAAPPTRASRLAQVNELEAMGLITHENAQELRDQLNRPEGA